MFQRLVQSFKYAMNGISFALRSQQNARIHGLITLCVLALGLWLRLPAVNWAILVLAMMVVWVSEFFNTALEYYVDLASPERNAQAKVAKDVAAGAVLVGAIGAVIVGLLILGPPLFERVF